MGSDGLCQAEQKMQQPTMRSDNGGGVVVGLNGLEVWNWSLETQPQFKASSFCFSVSKFAAAVMESERRWSLLD